ncbi:hypothetical protein BDAG_00953 [Burkholderia dolosa AU0158]|nr:hypothetical protein BDAG_00953 [Burkholderia dolosa AU0158]
MGGNDGHGLLSRKPRCVAVLHVDRRYERVRDRLVGHARILDHRNLVGREPVQTDAHAIDDRYARDTDARRPRDRVHLDRGARCVLAQERGASWLAMTARC